MSSTPPEEDTCTEDDQQKALRAGKALAGRALAGHPCQLSKSRGVRRCTHPDHPRDAEIATELLQAIGVLPTAAPVATSKALSVHLRVKSRCPVCKTRQQVRLDGTIGRHKPSKRSTAYCSGEGRRPLPPDLAEETSRPL